MNKSIYKLVEKVITEKLPQVKYFGLYRNQFFNSSGDREIPYPAVLLEIKPITFNQQLFYNQDSIVNITLHIGMNIVNNIERGDKMLDNSLSIIELMDDIHEYLDGIRYDDSQYSGTTETHISIGNFTRSSQDQISHLKGLWYGKISYSFPMVYAHKTGVLTQFIPTGITIFDSGMTFI